MTTRKIIYRAKSTTDIKADACTSLTNACNTSELLSNVSSSSCIINDKSKKDAFDKPIVKKHGQHRVSFADDFEGKKDMLCGDDKKNKKKGMLKKY